jgi:Bacterial mobilisation protein (MobC)
MSDPTAPDASPTAPRPLAGRGKRSRSGSETRKKSTPVTTRYDELELAELDDAASKAGLTRASYQRVQTLATQPKTRSTRRPPIERELLAKLLGQIGKVGSNLNQIAHAAHLDKAEHFEIAEVIRENRDLGREVMKAIGLKL